jgi:hypothetical protein
MRIYSKPRRAATIVEFALVASLTFLLIAGFCIGGAGVFRCAEIASLAREGSRWASVHGTGYAQDSGKTAASQQDVINYIIGEAAGLNTQTLQNNTAVTWSTSNSPYHTVIVNNQLVAVSNTVTVTISYPWIPEAYWGGITLTSTSTTTMAN